MGRGRGRGRGRGQAQKAEEDDWCVEEEWWAKGWGEEGWDWEWYEDAKRESWDRYAQADADVSRAKLREHAKGKKLSADTALEPEPEEKVKGGKEKGGKRQKGGEAKAKGEEDNKEEQENIDECDEEQGGAVETAASAKKCKEKSKEGEEKPSSKDSSSKKRKGEVQEEPSKGAKKKASKLVEAVLEAEATDEKDAAEDEKKVGKEKDTKAKASKKKEEPKEHEPAPTTLEAQLKELRSFFEQFKDVKLKQLKKEVRPFLEVPRVCALNVYWTRPACGLKCRATSNDFAYLRYQSSEASVERQCIAAVKCGEILAVRPPLSIAWFALCF